MEKRKKGRIKPVLIGVSVLVLVTVAVLCVLFFLKPTDSGQTDKPEQSAVDCDIYWNVDRDLYYSADGVATMYRDTGDDGKYWIRFFRNGETVELMLADRSLVNSIDSAYMMGLVLDESGAITQTVPIDDMPLQKRAWEFYVQTIDGNTVVTNSSYRFDGMEDILTITENTHIYDMTGVSGPVGTVTTLQEDDRIMALGDETGNITEIFVYGRQGINARINRYCEHCKEEASWSNWYHKGSLPSTTGHYYLTCDVQMSQQVSLQVEQKICLDLNGFTVTGAENKRVYSCHYAQVDLAVFDYSKAQTGKIVAWGEESAQGGCVWVRYGNFSLYGGTLDGSGVVSNVNGAVVAVPKGAQFDMYGGTIIGGKAKYSINSKGTPVAGMGGAVSVAGTMNMYGGTIRDGYAECYHNRSKDTYSQGYGGNVVVIGGTFNMYDGQILNGQAEGGGGNVYVTVKGAFNMYDGLLDAGRAMKKGKNGGNLVVATDCKFYMEDGIISNGRSFNYGGNAHIMGTMDMIGGSIYGGQIVDINTGTFKQEHTAKNLFLVNCDFNMYGGWIDGSVAVTDSVADDGVKPRIYLTGLARITGAEEGNNNLLINTGNDGVKVSVGEFYGNALIGITATGKFTEKTLEKNKDYFVCDKPGAEVTYVDERLFIGRLSCLCGYAEHIGECNGELISWTAWSNDSALPTTDGYYYLTTDVTCYQQAIAANAHVHLDLNGKTVSRSSGGRVYATFNPGAELTIVDSSAGKTGKIVANGQSANQGNVVWVRYGTFTLYGGTLDGSNVTATISGASVAVDKGTRFTMYGGTVKGGHAAVNSSGSYGCSGSIQVAGTFILEDGAVSGGKSDNHGGNIYITGTGVMEMNGGKVVDGMAAGAGKSGGNIYVESKGKLMVTGGQIVNGSCRNIGGNILLSGEMEMQGGTVSGGQRCTIGEDGTVTKTNFASGNINVVNGKLAMSGGYIDGHTAITSTAQPGAVLVLSDSAKIGTNGKYLTLVGSTVINISGVLGDESIIYIDADGIISGETVEQNADNFKARSGEPVSYKDGVLIVGGVTEQPQEVKHCVCGELGGKHIVNCTKTQVVWTQWDNSSKLPTASGNYYLSTDVTLSSVCSIPANAKIVLDLNGHTVQSQPGKPIGRLIFLNAAGAELTLTDTSAAQTGKLTQSGSYTSWTDGSLISVNNTSAKLTVFAGIFDSSGLTLSSIRGGVFSVNSGTCVLNGGTVIGAKIVSTNATQGGGAIRTNAKFYMYGGTVYGGTSSTNGDNIYISGGTATFSGGVVAGGVDLVGGKLVIDGNPVIDKAQTPAGFAAPAYSLRLASGKSATVTSVTADALILFTAAVGADVAVNVEDAAFFGCDDQTLKLTYDPSLKKLTMAA